MVTRSDGKVLIMKKMQKWDATLVQLGAALTVSMAFQGDAWSQMHEEHGREERVREVHVHRPAEIRHGAPVAYPAAGVRIGALPGPAVRVGDGRFFYHAGVWYSPCGGYYCVARPTFGLVVPVLPVDMLVLAFAGLTYYYANGIYYQAAPGGYVVVEPPPGIETVVPAQPVPTAPATPMIYPRNGQSAAQVQVDSNQCSNWAVSQPNVAGNVNAYNQAFAMCMDSRGYTVR
jgi:hypothetical protein